MAKAFPDEPMQGLVGRISDNFGERINVKLVSLEGTARFSRDPHKTRFTEKNAWCTIPIANLRSFCKACTERKLGDSSLKMCKVRLGYQIIPFVDYAMRSLCEYFASSTEKHLSE